jgi:phosphoglycerate dehydrogenase-like enzyme
LILALTKHVVTEDAAVRAGAWQRSLGNELAGATLGIIGLGNLGSKVAKIGAAFGMHVQAWSQNLDPDRAAALGVAAVTKEELLETSDVVTLHLRLSERTRGTIGPAELAAMRPTAVLVNTSRGPLVDTAALLEALRARAIRGAGLDVYDEEPLPADHPLRSAPNTVLTPHVGFVTREGYEHHFAQVVEGIAAWSRGAPLRVLNPADGIG